MNPPTNTAMKPTQTHTPGPWRLNGSQVTANGDWKAPVCVVVSKEDVQPTVDAAARTLAEARANARLIAAAPDLLAALAPLADLDRYISISALPDYCKPGLIEIRDAARVAIAKAKGGTV